MCLIWLDTGFSVILDYNSNYYNHYLFNSNRKTLIQPDFQKAFNHKQTEKFEFMDFSEISLDCECIYSISGIN
jgi:hypothetical protein